MPDRWASLLRDSLRGEFQDTPPIVTLATVVADRPRARSVVCRGIQTNGDVLLVSDARSAKNVELRDNPAASLVFWLPRARRQFRIEGSVQIHPHEASDAARSAAWAMTTHGP